MNNRNNCLNLFYKFSNYVVNFFPSTRIRKLKPLIIQEATKVMANKIIWSLMSLDIVSLY